MVAGYMLSAIIIGIIMSIITFIAGEAYIYASGGELMPVMDILKVLALIVLSVFTSTSIVYLLVSFVKTTNAYSTMCTIIGTMIGFLVGVYIPIGILPAGVQTVIKLVPVSHAAVIFRQIFMEKPMAELFFHADPASVTNFKEEFGVVFNVGDTTLSVWAMIGYLAAAGVVFFVVSVLRMMKKSAK